MEAAIIELKELCIIALWQSKRYWRLIRIDMLDVASSEWVGDEFYNG